MFKDRDAIATSGRGRERPAHIARAVLAGLMAGAAVASALAGCSGGDMTVNGKELLKSRFSSEVNRRIAIARQRNPRELEGSRGEKLTSETSREVATEMVRRALVEEQAARLGITLPPDAVKEKLEEERHKVGDDRFAADLKKQGLTEAEYEYNLKGELLVDALGARVTDGVTVTRGEAESFYLTNKEVFTRSLMIHVAHILLDTKGQAEVVADEARKKPEEFARLAEQVSTDYATRSNGGDMGWVERGTMDPAFENAAFALSSGEISPVIKTAEGYHVIKVLERREASTPPFAEVYSEAMQILESRKKEEAFGDWLRTLYANAVVDADGIGAWDPRIGMVVDR